MCLTKSAGKVDAFWWYSPSIPRRPVRSGRPCPTRPGDPRVRRRLGTSARDAAARAGRGITGSESPSRTPPGNPPVRRPAEPSCATAPRGSEQQSRARAPGPKRPIRPIASAATTPSTRVDQRARPRPIPAEFDRLLNSRRAAVVSNSATAARSGHAQARRAQAGRAQTRRFTYPSSTASGGTVGRWR